MDLLWRKGRVYKQCIAVEWERCFFAARWQDTIQANNNGKLFLCLMVVPVSSAGTLVERQEISLPSCCTLKGIMWNVGQWPAAAESVRSIHGSKREEKEQAWNGAGRAHTCMACHSVDEWVLGAFLLWTALPSFFSPSPFSSSCLRRPVDVYERLSWQIKYSLEMPPSIGDLIRERGYVRVFMSTNSLSQRTSFNYI